jgi:hypothetical protein
MTPQPKRSAACEGVGVRPAPTVSPKSSRNLGRAGSKRAAGVKDRSNWRRPVAGTRYRRRPALEVDELHRGQLVAERASPVVEKRRSAPRRPRRRRSDRGRRSDHRRRPPASRRPLRQRSGSPAPPRDTPAHRAIRLNNSWASTADGPTLSPPRGADCVADLGGSGASAVRADRRRTVSDDVRRDGRFRLSQADFVGLGQVGSSYRVGLQVGGRGFESRTLHLSAGLICRDSSSLGFHMGNIGASAVRADRR